MTNKDVYEGIYARAQELSSEVAEHSQVRGFEDYLADHVKLCEDYIQGFQSMNASQRNESSLLLHMLKEQIHGKLDCLRVKAIQGGEK